MSTRAGAPLSRRHASIPLAPLCVTLASHSVPCELSHMPPRSKSIVGRPPLPPPQKQLKSLSNHERERFTEDDAPEHWDIGLSTAVHVCPRQLGQILLLYQPIWLANPSIEQYHIVCPDVQAFFNLDLLGEDESVKGVNTQ